MPQIRYIRKNPPSPVYKPANGVRMSTVEPSPYIHGCRKTAVLYADGTIWCNSCERQVKADECVDIRRGRYQRPDLPQWKRIEVDK